MSASCQPEGQVPLRRPDTAGSRNPFRHPDLRTSYRAPLLGVGENPCDLAQAMQQINLNQTNAVPTNAKAPENANAELSTVRMDSSTALQDGAVDVGPSSMRGSLHSSRPITMRPTHYCVEPTTIATPGRPLLKDGRILVMPPTWEGCDECYGTGYQLSIPSRPHEPCWRAYGRVCSLDLLRSPDIVDAAMILQKPLPDPIPSEDLLSSMDASPNAQTLTGSCFSPPDHPPPESFGTSRTQSGNSLYTSPAGAPHPMQPPPMHPQQQVYLQSHGTLIPRPSPPRVNRAEAANEAHADADGEAPPAYEDVVRVPHGVPLPPQRLMSSGPAAASSRPSSSSVFPHADGQVVTHDYQRSHDTLTGAVPATGDTWHLQQVGPSCGLGYGSIGGRFAGAALHHQPFYQNGPPAPFGAYGGFVSLAPANFAWPARPMPFNQQAGTWQRPGQPPLVVRPGDPRIGGRICFKCGGSGQRQSVWWGEETCNTCAGIGRLI